MAAAAHDADALRETIAARGAIPETPNNPSWTRKHPRDGYLHAQRHLVGYCFGKLKPFRRVATRYETTLGNDLSLVTLAAILRWLRSVSTAPGAGSPAMVAPQRSAGSISVPPASSPPPPPAPSARAGRSGEAPTASSTSASMRTERRIDATKDQKTSQSSQDSPQPAPALFPLSSRRRYHPNDRAMFRPQVIELDGARHARPDKHRNIGLPTHAFSETRIATLHPSLIAAERSR